MDKLKYVKIENDDGTLSENIPIGVDAENVDVSIAGGGSENLQTNLDSKQTEINSLKTQTQTNTTSIAANTSAINTQKSRIDNLATLEEGSTTGDAELIDIRTGYDGTNYSSAGDAVRQSNELLNNLITLDRNRKNNGVLSYNTSKSKEQKIYNSIVSCYVFAKNINTKGIYITDIQYYNSKLFIGCTLNKTSSTAFNFIGKIVYPSFPSGTTREIIENNNYSIDITIDWDILQSNTIAGYNSSVFVPTYHYNDVEYNIYIKKLAYDNQLLDNSENAVQNQVLFDNLCTKIMLDEQSIENLTVGGSGSQYPKTFHFIKGKTYIITFSTEAETAVFQVGTLASPNEYIDSSKIYYNSNRFEDEKWTFTASNDSNTLNFYVRTSVSNSIDYTIEEVKYKIEDIQSKIETINDKIEDNAISIYNFNGIKDSVTTNDYWTQNNNYISLTHNEQRNSFLDEGLVCQKYVSASNRVITYDFVPYENSKICGYTQTATLESLFQQGYCISVDFQTKHINIHNKYGSSGTTISTDTPSVQKYVSFEEDNYIGIKHRLIIERTTERGVKASLYSLKDYTFLGSVETEFENKVVPTYGLGYDYPAFTVLNGATDLYYLGIKIKNSRNCFLYIIGDSLTEGVAIKPEKTWAGLVAENIPNTVISGRGGATINGVALRITDEASILKPCYILVMIGTNGGNTLSKLNSLITQIRNINAIPIISCIPCRSDSIQELINNTILSLDTPHIRMDIATSLNYDLNNGPDTNLFLSDGVHLNEAGYERMYKQVLIDCPFLFN